MTGASDRNVVCGGDHFIILLSPVRCEHAACLAIIMTNIRLISDVSDIIIILTVFAVFSGKYQARDHKGAPAIKTSTCVLFLSTHRPTTDDPVVCS